MTMLLTYDKLLVAVGMGNEDSQRYAPVMMLSNEARLMIEDILMVVK